MGTQGGDGTSWERDGDPAWDAEFAANIVGSTVLIGLTVILPNGTLHGREQFYGTIESVDRERGIEVALAGVRDGETYWLPPDLSSVRAADPGAYQLHATNETIHDPDYLSTWTVTRAD